jgi:hypothetical protein
MLLTLGLIPLLIIIHRLKPKPRPVEVTNLFLWNQVIREKNRNLSFERFKKNLPLLLQIIMVILAAMALANPTRTIQTAPKGNLILVMDTSASMKTRTGSGIRFDLAREKALKLIAKRDRGQKIFIVEAGKKATVKSGFMDNTKAAQAIVKELQPSDAAVNLETAVYLALSFVDPAKEDFVHLITDGAGKDFSTLVRSHPKIRPIVITGGKQNVGITKFEFRQQVDYGDHYEFMLEIKNFDHLPVKFPVRLSIDRWVLFEQSIAFEAQEKKLLIIPYSGLINGIARATLEIEDDFSVDNRSYLSLNAAKEIWVLLVSKGNHFLERLLAAYPNFRVNSVKEIIPSSWPEQTARHDIVIVDRMDFPATDRGNFLLIDAYSPSIPLIETGRIRLPKILTWDRKSPLMANVNLKGLIIEEGTQLQAARQLQPVIESDRAGLMYAFEENGLRVVHFGFDFTRSDLPLKVAFPVMMSNIFNWLNPHKLEFSILQTRAGEPFDIYLKPQTDTLYTRAPYEKWDKHPVKINPFTYQNTGTVGIYTIAENGKERYFTVNLADESESDINPTAIENLPDQSESTRVAQKISARQSLWMILVFMVCMTLVVEWYSWLKS